MQKDFFEWASNSGSSIQYEWVGSGDISNCDDQIKQMDLQPVKRTMRIHSLFGLSDKFVVTRQKSCFCDKCFLDGSFATEGSFDGWEQHTIKRIDKNLDEPEIEPQVPMEIEEEYNK